jgi:hypothetical protein
VSSLTYKLEALAAKKAAGKRAVVKINGIDYAFGSVIWGGTSPRVSLIAPDGTSQWASAAEWKRLGAKL